MKHYLHHMQQAIRLALAIGLSVACSNPGKSGGTDTPKASGENKQSEDARPIAPNPTDASGTRIVMSFKNLAALKNITGYVVDGVDQHGFKSIDSARYAFFSMKPGRYDIIVEGQRAGDNSSQSSVTAVGIRINGLTVKAGEDTLVREAIELLPTFAIKGQARIFEALTHGAIQVEIPGTRIKTKTETDGTFTLAGVPNGSHSIVASNPDYLDASYESRNWSAQDTLELKAVTLLPQDKALPTGVHYKGEGMIPNEENLITVFMTRPAGMNKMRISETADFAAAAWQDYQSSLDWKFTSGGERKIFVQFAKDQTQLSAVFHADIPLAQP